MGQELKKKKTIGINKQDVNLLRGEKPKSKSNYTVCTLYTYNMFKLLQRHLLATFLSDILVFWNSSSFLCTQFIYLQHRPFPDADKL